jgi:hypothetical protein
MKRSRRVVVAFAALVMFTVPSCGGHGTAVAGGGTPAAGSSTPAVASGIPSAWTAAPGWVRVAASSGGVDESSWAHGPYFHSAGGRVRVIGSLTSDDPSRFQWEVRLYSRQAGGGQGVDGVGVKMQKTARDPARSDEMYFEGTSERPLIVGDYRTAIMGTSGTYGLTVYVRK